MNEHAVVIARLQLQAQGGRRGLRGRTFRAEQEGQHGAGRGGNLEPPQAGKTDLVRPGQYRAATAIPEHLFAGPQRFPAAACAYQQQPLQQ